MPVSTPTLVRAEGNLKADFPDDKITPHLESAEFTARLNVDYDAIVALGEANPDYKKLQKIESLLAISTGVIAWNINSIGHGLVQSAGLNKNAQDLLTANDIKTLSRIFQQRAESLMRSLNSDIGLAVI